MQAPFYPHIYIRTDTMADRKVYVNVTTRLIIRADEGVDVNAVLEDMDYSFTSQTDEAEIEGTEVTGWDIVDSK
jgi:hypothetical protein